MKTVLIVDDNREIVDTLEFFIKKLGYNTLASQNGESAMYNLLTQSVDLVLCDIRMPSCSGDELMRAMQENTMKYPVIFMTGYADDAVVKEMRDLGAVDVLEKPLDISSLENKIRGVLK